MKYLVSLGGKTLTVDVNGSSVTVNGTAHRAELRAVEGTPLRLLVLDDASWVLPMDEAGTHTWLVQSGGERHEVEVLDERTAHIRGLAGAGSVAGGPKSLKAPMPGMVIRVTAEVGQEVSAGQSLVVLEAMKMENDLKAAGPGTVESVTVASGQTVEKGTVLVTFRP